jgi:hypothetical protein
MNFAWVWEPGNRLSARRIVSSLPFCGTQSHQKSRNSKFDFSEFSVQPHIIYCYIRLTRSRTLLNSLVAILYKFSVQY